MGGFGQRVAHLRTEILFSQFTAGLLNQLPVRMIFTEQALHGLVGEGLNPPTCGEWSIKRIR